MPSWQSWALGALLAGSTALWGLQASTTGARLLAVENQHAELLKAVGTLPIINERLGRIEQYLLEGGRLRVR